MISNVSSAVCYDEKPQILRRESRRLKENEQVERVQFHFRSIPEMLKTLFLSGTMVFILIGKLFPDGFGCKAKRYITMEFACPDQLTYTASHHGCTLDWLIELNADDEQDIYFENALWKRIEEIL